MFTGIIRTTGKIRSMKRFSAGYKVSIQSKISLNLNLGDSVAINGICLTVANIKGDTLAFDISSETVFKTTLSDFKVNLEVNLEPAMKAEDMFGGHMVSGHVDGVGKVLSVRKEKADTRITVKPPENVAAYIVDQGSVAVDGVSLTVAKIFYDKSFEVVLIPHTLAETNLKNLKPGSRVNVEGDMVGKYIRKYIDEQFGEISKRLSAIEEKI